MKRPLQILLLSLICGIQLLPSISHADGGLSLFPFKAEYQLSLGNMTFGHVSVTLQIDTQGHYQYQAHTVTTGLVAIFRDDEVTEMSTGTISPKGVKPQQYSYSHKRPERHREVDLTFKWDEHKVINKAAESLWSMSIVEKVQDKLSQQLALILDLNEGLDHFEYRVADGGRLKSYHYTNLGSEEITTPAGNYHTIKLARQKEQKESNATLWMAPELNYFPVKIIRYEGDKQFEMALTGISWQR